MRSGTSTRRSVFSDAFHDRYMTLNNLKDTVMRSPRTLSLCAMLGLLVCTNLPAGPQLSYTLPGQRSVTPKIIGGVDALPGAWPWMVGLLDPAISSNYFAQFCGGTLISPSWVVTASHCTVGSGADDIEILVGVNDLQNDPGERIPVKRIIEHPDYNDRTLFNDIALIQLSRPATQTPAVAYSGPDTLEGVLATIIGWGDTDPTFRSDYPSVLQQTEIPIISNADCKSVYGANAITDGMLCAGLTEGGKDTCQGDSGGPLLIPNGNGWELAGITSFGTGCAQPGFYGVYTRVSQYADFIQSTLSTDYQACADANGDSVIDLADVTQHKTDGRNDFMTWLNDCFRTRNSCGDSNGDGTINRTDLVLKWLATRDDHRDWLKICYLPEVN